MDRDPSAKDIAPEERVTPSSGNSDYGDHGDERRRIAEERDDDLDQGTEPPQPLKVPLNPD